jgi:hypothetical protein
MESARQVPLSRTWSTTPRLSRLRASAFFKSPATSGRGACASFSLASSSPLSLVPVPASAPGSQRVGGCNAATAVRVPVASTSISPSASHGFV